ncbi:lysophospholipid acyltransferase family protein [Stakelama saccharophila]|uniref:Lysophospholipid acyltransferase family protein n=1 Tax=Stakelama saccharophila TaxID=3075605 RepID=A0ABZ0BBA5_9SPHN|nr:lysophospholipid acyltransferase family protein [Stakelama sp. W311]WNO54710.1 lysophospholipid acyltransferase family protein [Stakelama sp. W311]
MASPSTARADAAAGRPPRLTIGGRLRLAIRLALLFVATLVAVPLYYLWRLFRFPNPWPRLFLGACARIVGARVRRVGTPLRRNVFYIANHLSWIDILAMAGASGTAFIAKAELEKTPVIGWLASFNRTVYVSRQDRMGVAAQIERLREALAENWAITVFPEGTTTDGRSLLKFKTAMLRVLEPPPAGVMVQPVMLDYHDAGEDIAWIGAESGKDNAMRILARRGSFPVSLHFLDPFSPADHAGRKAIAAESRRRIEQALTAALGHPLRDFAY